MFRLVQSVFKQQVKPQHIVVAARFFGASSVVTKTAAASVVSNGRAKPKRAAAGAKSSKTTTKAKAKKAKVAKVEKPKKKKPKKKELSAEEKMIRSRKALVAFPKSPIRSGYLLFFKTQFKDVGASSPGQTIKVAEVAREMSLKWKRMDEAEKAKYGALAKAQRAQYEKDVVDWWKSVDHKLVELENKRRKRINKNIRDKVKAGETVRGSKLALLKDPFQPKRPLSAYMKFCKSELTGFGNGSGARVSEYMKQIGTKWRSMSEGQKAPFVQAAHNDMAAYKKAAEQYVSSTHH
ncbi:hypothetical protein EV175_006196 [Coemansia sp. RSA 1933]|nr:hypothetical protein EV175_006196 [Coemansia sp. RSA 1933]